MGDFPGKGVLAMDIVGTLSVMISFRVLVAIIMSDKNQKK